MQRGWELEIGGKRKRWLEATSRVGQDPTWVVAPGSGVSEAPNKNVLLGCTKLS